MEIKNLFSLLESGKADKIQQALDYLATDAKKTALAEQRYLPLIRARLRNPAAQLSDILAASPSADLVKKIQTLLSHDGYLSLEYLSDEESSALVDLVGGILASCFDVEAQLEKARAAQNHSEIKDLMASQVRMLYAPLKAQIDQSGNTWFTKIAKKMRSAKNLQQLNFDHTNFETANQSPVLREFIFFLFEKKKKYRGDCPNRIYLDIAQSDTINLTEIIWLVLDYRNFLYIKVQDAVAPQITACPFHEYAVRYKWAFFPLHVTPNEFANTPHARLDWEEIEPLGELFRALESCEESTIQKALDELEYHAGYKAIAEKRYLKFIRARLNKADATLADLYAASPTKDEMRMIKSVKHLNPKKYTFQMKGLTPKEAKAYVDLMGGVLAGCLEVEPFIEAAKATSDEAALNDLIWGRHAGDQYGEFIRHLISRQTRISNQQYAKTQTWFGEIANKLLSTNEGGTFYNLDFFKFHLSDEAATAFNESLVIKEFMFYLFRSTWNNGFSIEIKQAVFPNLTELFWLFSQLPSFKIKAQDMDLMAALPANPLNYNRELPVTV